MKKLPDSFAIHCPTEDLAKKVIQCLHDLKYKWASGEEYSPEETYWSVFEKETCYSDRGTYFSRDQLEGFFTIINGEKFLKKYAPFNYNLLRLKKSKRIKLNFTL